MQNTTPFGSHGGFSDYHSLQARVEHRFGNGLFFLNSFTWSKAIDTAAGSLENPNGNFAGPQDFNNLRAEKGLSAYDQPLTNTTSFVYQSERCLLRRFRFPASSRTFAGPTTTA